MLELKTFHPGKTYEFSVAVDEDFKNIVDKPDSIRVFAMSLSQIAFALNATKTKYIFKSIQSGWMQDPSEYIKPFLSNLKHDSWVKTFPRKEDFLK